jgi:cysteinyl-tRNA synthetase
MIRRCLGEQIDIHTGGIEHIPVHHNNEIAQSEAAIGKRPLSRFWMHREHIQFQGGKLAKSAGNAIHLSDIVGKGFHPLALRYLFLGAHYRTPANFSWEALEAAQTAYLRLRAAVQQAPQDGIVPEDVRLKFVERINDDLDTPGALSVLWENAKELSAADFRALAVDADRILGLELAGADEKADALIQKKIGKEVALEELSAPIRALVDEREEARSRKDWPESDRLRDELKEKGYFVEDKPGGPLIVQK